MQVLATATPQKSCTDFNSVSTRSTNAVAEQLASIVLVAFRFLRFFFPFSPFLRPYHLATIDPSCGLTCTKRRLSRFGISGDYGKYPPSRLAGIGKDR